MSGPAPKRQRRRTNEPARGDWRPAPGIGWQHGPIPTLPDGMADATREAWQTWMRAWFASNWSPGDLPGLLVLIRIFDRVASGNAGATLHSELRRWLDTYGISPAGHQARRWLPPETDQLPAAPRRPAIYGHLRSVDDLHAPKRSS